MVCADPYYVYYQNQETNCSNNFDYNDTNDSSIISCLNEVSFTTVMSINITTSETVEETTSNTSIDGPNSKIRQPSTTSD